MSEIKPGATVLNIAAKCPKCQTTFTQETNVYDLAVRQLTERAEKAEAACAEMRDALRQVIPFACAYKTHQRRNPEDRLDLALEKCQQALSSDCGKDYIHKSELDFFKEAYMRDACNGCYPLPYEDSQKREVMHRLESLRKDQSK